MQKDFFDVTFNRKASALGCDVWVNNYITPPPKKILFTCQYTIYFKKYNYLYHEFITSYGDIDKT